jgi:hypothetical protein
MAVYVTQAASAYRMEQPTGTYAEQITRWWGSMWGSQKSCTRPGEFSWRIWGGDHSESPIFVW